MPCDSDTFRYSQQYDGCHLLSDDHTYSRKPGGTYILSPTSAKYIIQMAEVMGRKVSYLLETVSPLQFRKESLEMALVFSKSGQPATHGPDGNGGGHWAGDLGRNSDLI